MKNLMFWVAALAMVFFTSCQQEQTTVVENATVDFTITTPAISTRAAEAEYGDGATVNVLEYALFEAELDANNNVVSLIGTPQTGEMSNAFAEDGEDVKKETALVGIPAIKGKSYAILFWAEADNNPYTVDWATQTVTINDAALKANNENLDAFFGVHTFTMTETAQQETAYLKRPFAQLNIATTDKSDAADAKVTVTETYVAVEAPKSLNILTGRTTTAETVVFDSAAIPTDKYVDLDKDGKYDLISFNYIFVDTEKSLTDVTFKYKYSEGSDTMEYVFDKITLERNHRTYIVGSLLTEEVIFNVEINPIWEDSHIFHGNGTGSTPPEPVDVPEPVIIDNATMNGYEKVQLSWEVGDDVAKTIVSWGENDSETTEFAITQSNASMDKFLTTRAEGKSMTETIEVDEGEYTFKLVNVDANGNKSDAVTVDLKAYGETWLNSLVTRPVKSVDYVGSTKKATITFDTWDQGITTLKHNSTSIGIENSETSKTFDNVALGDAITITTSYAPRYKDHGYISADTKIIESTEYARSIVSIKAMQLNAMNDSGTWDSRATQIADLVKDNNVEVLGLQELYTSSGEAAYNTLMNKLGSTYSGLVFQREYSKLTDSNTWAKEGSALVWLKTKFTLVTSGRWWYNDGDWDTAGKTDNADGHAAGYERFAIWAILKDITSGIEFFVTTTHIDNAASVSGHWAVYPVQWYQCRWLVQRLPDLAKYTGSDVLRSTIILGDFNCNESHPPIATGLGAQQHNHGNINDTYELATNRTSPDGTRGTMNNADGTQVSSAHFDYIFVSKTESTCSKFGETYTLSNNQVKAHNDTECAKVKFDDCKVEVLSHTIHPAKHNNVRISDHNAVSVQLKYTYPNPE